MPSMPEPALVMPAVSDCMMSLFACRAYKACRRAPRQPAAARSVNGGTAGPAPPGWCPAANSVVVSARRGENGSRPTRGGEMGRIAIAAAAAAGAMVLASAQAQAQDKLKVGVIGT